MKYLDMLRDWKDRADYSAGAVIFSEGDASDVVYVVMSGQVELTFRGESLGVESEGGIVGVMAMSDSTTSSATATALTDVSVARFDRSQLTAFITENPEFSLHIMAVLANRLRAVDQFIRKRL